MIRIVVADDELLIRDAMEQLLNLAANMEVVAVASTGADALAQIERHGPDIALVDLQLPDITGIEVARRARNIVPDCKIAIFTSHGRPGYVNEALEAGVQGFVPKTITGPEFFRCIEAIIDGKTYFDERLMATALAHGRSPLSERESQILRLAADGAPIEDIAAQVNLSVGTVRNYISSALAKLNTTNRHQATQIARSKGWI